MTECDTFDPERTTVHHAMRRWPAARDAFGRLGIDACCGGELPLAVAARRHGVELDVLLATLEGAPVEPGRG